MIDVLPKKRCAKNALVRNDRLSCTCSQHAHFADVQRALRGASGALHGTVRRREDNAACDPKQAGQGAGPMQCQHITSYCAWAGRVMQSVLAALSLVVEI